jgi:hypothetical protein
MRQFALSAVLVLVFASGMGAQEKEISPEKLVNLMRSVNTLQAEFKDAYHKFATTDELLAAAKTQKLNRVLVFATELTPSVMFPYTLQVTPSEDGAHYQATIKRPTEMHNKATWCKTAVFSDDSGLIYLGQNIGCPEAKSPATSQLLKPQRR